MAIAIVALLAFGGSYAYFTAVTGELASSGLKTGKVTLTTEATSTIIKSGTVMPGDALITGDVAYAYETTDENGQWISVRVTVTSAATGLVDAVVTEGFKIGTDFGDATSITDTTNGKIATYTIKVEKGTGTKTLDDATFVLPLSFGGAGNVQTEAALMNADVTVKIEAKAIQGSSVGSATAAEALMWA